MVSVLSGSLGLVGQVLACMICWVPVIGWLPVALAVVGSLVGLATGLVGRSQAMQTGIGAAAADAGIALSLLTLAIEVLMLMVFLCTCGLPTVLGMMDV